MARPDAVTGKRQLNLLSPEEEATLGAEFEGAILKEYRAQGCAIDADAEERGRLTALMTRIVSVSHRPELPLTLHLLESEEFNAFATVGGYVFVNRGLIRGPMALRSDDEVAAVLGHEWAHVTAGHIAESLSRRKVDRNMEKSALYRVSFTTESEDEADRVGILYAALAGHDPMAASRIWERFAAGSGDSAGNFLHDHPLDRQRAESARVYGSAAAQYRVDGQVNPDARAILADNAVTGRKESTQGLEALLSGAAEYASQVQRTKAEVASRRSQRAELERGFVSEPGMAEAASAFSKGKVPVAEDAYLRVARANPENYMAIHGLGRCLALRGSREEAVQVLQLAVGRGFHNHRLLAEDRALVSLRGDARFAELIKAAKSLD